MARIRSIKPEFWRDYKMAHELTLEQRLFYIGLWTEADDEGRFLAHPRRLLGAIFPYDRQLDETFVTKALESLRRTSRVLLYEVDGEPYGQLTKFSTHQRISHPAASYIPPADSPNAVPHHDLENPPEGLRRSSGAAPELARAREEQGGGKGEVEQGTCMFARFRETYPRRDGGQRWREAQHRWNARIKEGRTAEEIVEAAGRYRSWCDAKGKTGTEVVMQAATFLGSPENLDNPWTPASKGGGGNGKQRVDPRTVTERLV